VAFWDPGSSCIIVREDAWSVVHLTISLWALPIPLGALWAGVCAWSSASSRVRAQHVLVSPLSCFAATLLSAAIPKATNFTPGAGLARKV
jgi:hypothetical protein